MADDEPPRSGGVTSDAEARARADAASPHRTARKLQLNDVALGLSVVGLCLPPVVLVGMVLGVVSLVRGGPGRWKGHLAVWLPIVMVTALLGLSQFSNRAFKGRARQSECKTNLKMAYTGAKALLAEQDVLSSSAAAIWFVPERRNRYLYRLAAEGPLAVAGTSPDGGVVGYAPDLQAWPDIDVPALEAAIPAQLRAEVGVHGTCPDQCWFTFACAGNIDGDEGVDVWSISSKERKDRDGQPVPAGQVRHEVDDLE